LKNKAPQQSAGVLTSSPALLTFGLLRWVGEKPALLQRRDASRQEEYTLVNGR